MAKFKVLEEAGIRYQLTTWQGTVNVDDEAITYRYSEDDNGSEFYVYTEGSGYERVDFDSEESAKHKVIYAAILEWGNPEEFGVAGEEVDIDDELVKEYTE